MARQSKKTEAERIAEARMEIARLEAIQAEKQYSGNKAISSLRAQLESIQTDLANTRPLLAEDGIRSFSERIRGAELKVKRYQAEREHNLLIAEHGQKQSDVIASIMSEAIQSLSKGGTEESVSKMIESSMRKYQKENAATFKLLKDSAEHTNSIIKECEEFSRKYANKESGKERSRFRTYQTL